MSATHMRTFHAPSESVLRSRVTVSRSVVLATKAFILVMKKMYSKRKYSRKAKPVPTATCFEQEMSQHFDSVFAEAFDFVLARALVGANLMQMLVHVSEE